MTIQHAGAKMAEGAVGGFRRNQVKNNLSSEQIERYRSDGFLVIEGFLDAEELEKWRNYTDEAVAQRLDQTRPGWNNQHDPDAYYAQVFTQCIRLADTHEGMAELMLDPCLGQVAATLAGIDGIRIWHDQALIKPPWGNPTAWHLDDPYSVSYTHLTLPTKRIV